MLGFFGPALAGELNGTLDPRYYGFEVVREEPLSVEEQLAHIIDFYLRTKDRTGVSIPSLEALLPKPE